MNCTDEGEDHVKIPSLNVGIFTFLQSSFIWFFQLHFLLSSNVLLNACFWSQIAQQLLLVLWLGESFLWAYYSSVMEMLLSRICLLVLFCRCFSTFCCLCYLYQGTSTRSCCWALSFEWLTTIFRLIFLHQRRPFQLVFEKVVLCFLKLDYLNAAKKYKLSLMRIKIMWKK